MASVKLDLADVDTLGEAMTLAWQGTDKPPKAARSKPRRRLRS